MAYIRTAIAGLAAILALTGCQASVQQLSADEMRATLVDTTGYGTYGSGKTFVTYLAPDGTVMTRTEDQVGTGQYRIQPNGLLCMHYQAAQQDQDVCQTVWKGYGKFYSTLANGTPGVVITKLLPGNPESL